VSEAEKERLNQLGRRLFIEGGLVLEDCIAYDLIRNEGYAGYADLYLQECWNESEMKNEAVVSIYRQLIDIDSKLGTNASLQLCCCLLITTRWDLIKVWFSIINVVLNLFKNIDFEEVNEYNELMKLMKFADLYLARCKQQSKLDDEIDVRVYSKLVELDLKLGTTPSALLCHCLCFTLRSDIIKVHFFDLTNVLNDISNYRYFKLISRLSTLNK